MGKGSLIQLDYCKILEDDAINRNKDHKGHKRWGFDPKGDIIRNVSFVTLFKTIWRSSTGKAQINYVQTIGKKGRDMGGENYQAFFKRSQQ